jgi:dihydroorotase
MGALTRELDGQHLSEMATLSKAGCIAFGQADHYLDNTGVLLSAMEYAATFDLPVFLTPRDGMVATNGCAHAGAPASILGLPGIPVAAETVALAKLIELARSTGCKLHISRLSSARAVQQIQNAKESGLSITADVGIHHLYFTDAQLTGFDVNFHSAVPFRSQTDRAALRQGVANGTIDAICSDHSPHDLDAKLAPFPASAPGLNALDFFLPLILGLPQLLNVSLETILKCITTSPQNIINHTDGSIDEVVLDTTAPACLLENALLSGGINSPLLGHSCLHDITGEDIPLNGRVLAVRIN